ncbi:hypothetical protein ACVWZ3_002170 [Bradyrhizobium sp. i1.3.6]
MMRAGIRRLHVRQHGLGGEELVLQVHRDAVVPVFRRHLLGFVPFVMCGIVDEDIDRAVCFARLGDAGAQRGDVSQVDALEMRSQTLIRQLACEAFALVGLDVEEHDIGFLLREAPHDRSPNPRCATGDENDLAGKVGINGGHGHLSSCVAGGARRRPVVPPTLAIPRVRCIDQNFSCVPQKSKAGLQPKNKSRLGGM